MESSPHPQVLVLHNNGVVAMGESVEEAFGVAHSLVKACDIQVSIINYKEHFHS